MKTLRHFLLLFFTFHIFCIFAEEAITVRLSKPSQLLPIYAAPFQCEDKLFSCDYLKKLEQILNFDLGHNGSTQVVPHNAERIKETKTPQLHNYDAPFWKKQRVYYVVKTLIQNKNLYLSLYNVRTNEVKSLKELPLSGQLDQDRKILHRIADAIYKNLFDKEGIANTHILYSVRKKNQKDPKSWISEIWSADYDGSNAYQITHENNYCISPSYLPALYGYKNQHFFYVSYQSGQPKIYLASLKDGKGQRLTYLRGNQLMPSLSSQRDQVAFICDAAGRADIFIQAFHPDVGAIGKPFQVFSAYRATQASPVFSPDGKKLAFVSDKNGSPRIYLMEVPKAGSRIDDVKAKLISKNNKESSCPSWSPDGRKIAYSSKVNGIRQIWIYDVLNQEERQLTEGPGHKENPTWAPNSLHLIFNSANQKSSDLYLIHLNTNKATKISSGPGEKRFPSWESKSLS